jgi:hypothetical protein
MSVPPDSGQSEKKSPSGKRKSAGSANAVNAPPGIHAEIFLRAREEEF